jgi:hypothetical protein
LVTVRLNDDENIFGDLAGGPDADFAAVTPVVQGVDGGASKMPAA